MEKQIVKPVLQKTKESKSQSTFAGSSCCSKPADNTPCCTPGQSPEENNGACCAQPADGSACCDN